MTYKHLTFDQCCKVSAYWKAGYLQKEIAKEIGVSESTISRELKRTKYTLEWYVLARTSTS